MHFPTDWQDRLEIGEDGMIWRILRAFYHKKNDASEIDVYKENELGEAASQNLYTSYWGGYAVAFPGFPFNPNKNSYWYNDEIVEGEMGFGECKLLNVGSSSYTTKHELEVVYSKYPDFRYVVEKYPEARKSNAKLMKILRMWIKHPQLELVLACGYYDIGMNGNFWRMNKDNQKKICLFMRKNPKYCGAKLNDLRQGLKLNEPQLYLDYCEDIVWWRRNKSRSIYHFEDCVLITFSDYKYLLLKLKKTVAPTFADLVSYYWDYLEMLRRLNHIEDEYWRHPKDLKKMHDKAMQEIEAIRIAKEIAEQEAKRKEFEQKAKQLQKICRKYDYKNSKVDGYDIFVTSNINDWEIQANVLNQCILTAGYYEKMADKDCVIVFIQKDGIPQATAQIKKDGTLGQFYADEHDRDNCLPTEEIKIAFNKWFNQKKPRKNHLKEVA